MATPAYPAHLISTWQSPQGETVTLRPIRPEDAEIEQAFVRDLSPESRRFRFMDASRELTPKMLTHFTQIDYEREMAIIATVNRDQHEMEIGVCRYVVNPDEVSCEFAIVIADEWQRRGLGRGMMIKLIAVARAGHLQAMTGYVLRSNHRMLNFCTGLGFVAADSIDDPALKLVTLVLAAG